MLLIVLRFAPEELHPWADALEGIKVSAIKINLLDKNILLTGSNSTVK